MKRMKPGSVVFAALAVFCFAGTPSFLQSEPITGAGDAAKATDLESQPQEIKDALDRFNARDFDGALKSLQEAVKQNADFPPAQVIMAQLFAQSNIPVLARNALEQAVVESPDDPEAYLFMGEMALRERRIAEAELIFRKAESLLANFTKSEKRKKILQSNLYSGLAQVSESRMEWDDAKKRLEAWLAFDPDSSVARQRLARCLVYQKNLAGALDELKKAAKVDPELLTPEAILARLCEQAGDHDSAAKYMKAALEAAPKNTLTRLIAARWAFDTNQLDEAKTQAVEAMKLDEKSLDAKILRGLIAFHQKDFRTAERYFEDAYQQARDNFAASNNLALALAEQGEEGKLRRALTLAETNIRLNQKSPEAVSTYGWILYKLGKLDEADQAIRAAISSGATSPDTAYYLARLDVDRHRDSEAKMLLESALKNTGPFSMRPEAQALLDQIAKKPQSTNP